MSNDVEKTIEQIEDAVSDIMEAARRAGFETENLRDRIREAELEKEQEVLDKARKPFEDSPATGEITQPWDMDQITTSPPGGGTSFVGDIVDFTVVNEGSQAFRAEVEEIPFSGPDRWHHSPLDGDSWIFASDDEVGLAWFDAFSPHVDERTKSHAFIRILVYQAQPSYYFDLPGHFYPDWNDWADFEIPTYPRYYQQDYYPLTQPRTGNYFERDFGILGDTVDSFRYAIHEDAKRLGMDDAVVGVAAEPLEAGALVTVSDLHLSGGPVRINVDDDDEDGDEDDWGTLTIPTDTGYSIEWDMTATKSPDARGSLDQYYRTKVGRIISVPSPTGDSPTVWVEHPDGGFEVPWNDIKGAKGRPIEYGMNVAFDLDGNYTLIPNGTVMHDPRV